MSISKGIALVTGSAQGIGRSIALRLAMDGFDIALNDIVSKRDQLHAVADEVEQIGRRAHVVTADVSVDTEVKGMIQEVVDKLGGLDVMVANAGVGDLADLFSTELDKWDRVMAINARGTFLCYKYAAAQMVAQGRGGRIIGASSAAGKAGRPLSAAYSASKFAVRGLTQTAALELGRHKITVNSYAPGLIETPMTATMFESKWFQPEKETDESVKWNMANLATRPIKHDGQPEDIASIVGYLASKESHFITGQCVSGGSFVMLNPDRKGILTNLQQISVDGGINLS